MSEKKQEKQERKEAKRRVRRDPATAKAEILAAAVEVISELGPSQAGLKEVAKRAGVSHGLVTHYFGTYASLVEQVVESHMTALRESLLIEAQNWAGKLDVGRLLRIVYGKLREPKTIRLMTWAHLAGQLEELSAFVDRHQGMRAVSDVLAWSQQSKGIPIDSGDIDRLMVMVLSAMSAYALAGSTFWRALGHTPSEARDEEFLELLTELITQRLSASAPRATDETREKK